MRYEPRPFSYSVGRTLYSAYFQIMHRLKVYGANLCPAEGPLIIVANHCSFIDPPLVIVAFKRRQIRFMAKIELWKGKFLSWYLTDSGMIPVQRKSGGKIALEDAAKIIQEGGCVGMFPEGTRSLNGEVGRGRTGAVVLAARTGATLLPVYLEGTYESLPSGAKGIKLHPIKVYVGEPFELAEDEQSLDDRKKLRESAEKLMVKITGAREKYVGKK